MSEAFDPAWLELREPVDHRSRDRQLLEPLRSWWAAGRRSAVVDLGCGTGSNMRYLAPELPGARRWTLVDHDPGLLSRIEARTGTPPGADLELDTVHGDLAEEGLAAVPGSDLVTASALLDLVPGRWLEKLADASTRAGCAALFALTYDGTVAWEGEPDPVDDLVRDAVNAHQRRDKGMGGALGPAAASTAEALFRERGYRTWLAVSPWRLGPPDAELVRALVDGWSRAAAEQRPDAAEAVRGWAERRAEARTGLTVGHLDLLALPASP